MHQAGINTAINTRRASNTDMAASSLSKNGRNAAIILNRVLYHFSRHWLLAISLLLIIFNGLPWLAPVFMEQGWQKAGEAVYLIYSLLCHQMPQRSFFLFGSSPMVPLDTVQAIWQDTANPLVLRQFVGNADVGWKVAWSDRMVYMYTSPLLFGLAFWPLRRHLKPLSLWAFLLFLLPMAVDGTTHIISELFGGIGGGFRYTNGWLAALTNHAFPATFYVGDSFGSFNAWMRLLSGLFFGLGTVWFAYPRFHLAFNETANKISLKFQNAKIRLEFRE
ncbi:MAG: hypothetical protein CL608_03865 [Anaerolineaceae bacterium]|nr:hypothetical protein [Anaerolineaceae bacterium]